MTIKSFFGNSEDKELLQLIPFLTKLAEEEDVRPVTEKYINFCKICNQVYKQSTKNGEASDIHNFSNLKGTSVAAIKEKKRKRVSFECDLERRGILKSKSDECDEGYDEGLDENLVVHEIFRIIREDSHLFDVIKSKPPKKNLGSRNKLLTKLSTADTKSFEDSDTKLNNMEHSEIFSQTQEMKESACDASQFKTLGTIYVE